MKTILVTGDRGYIGSVLVEKLLENGYVVRGIDAGFADEDGVGNLSGYEQKTKDIRDISEDDLKGVDAIIHLSALSNDPIGALNPDLTTEINYKSTVKLAKMAKKIGIKRFIFSSSCSVYGIAKKGIVNENSKVNPLTAYAKSKVLSERALRKISSKDFCVGILRNSTVYGFSPKFRNDLVVNNLVSSALAFNTIKVMSDGSPWRPLIDVRDLAEIFILFLKAPENKINGKIINVGFNENNFTVAQIVEKIQKKLPKVSVVFTGEHGSDSRSYRVEFDQFRKAFPSYKQKWTMDKSISDMIKNLKKVNFSKKDFERGKYVRLSYLKNLILSGKINSNLRINEN